jgi:KaiC/GvpD/RAD55 family RecA-like ATPase
LPEDEGEAEDLDEDEEATDVMPNGGVEVVELNVPDAMRRYMIAMQRTLPAEVGLYEEDDEGSPEYDTEVVSSRATEVERLAIEPEELKLIQETFNVHSIEEILETLKMKEEELIRIKSDFSIKMRNTLALQRIKFEKEINDMKKRMEEFSEYTKADEYLKKREDEFRRKERTLEQKEEEFDELKAQMETLGGPSGGSILDGGGAEAKDLIELKEIIEEQALEVTQLETKMNRARAEVEEVKTDLEREKRKTGEAEGELSNLKKGSIAMMKYVTSMQRKKTEEEVADLKRSIEDEQKRRQELEKDLETKETALRARDMDVDKAIAKAVSDGAKGADMDTIAKLNQEIRMRGAAIEAKERDLELKRRKIVSQLKKLKEERDRMKAAEREAIDERMAQLPDFQEQLMEKNEQLRDYRAQVDVLNEQLSKLKKAVTFKDDEFERRQQELQYKEKLVEKEQATLREAREAAGGSTEVLAARKEVDRLEKLIGNKEAELKAKEAFLAQKERELQIKEQAVISDNLEVAAKERESEISSNKAKTGTDRLDDLLFGGLPLGANVIITGPPFIGKEVLVERFVVEGITKGIPSVLILSDYSPAEMRASLSNHVPSVDEYERLGLIKYIDAYSMPMGVEPEEDNENIIYVKEATAYGDIIAAMDKFTKILKKKHEYYRVIVASISTFITYSDVKATYGFLQKLTGRLKRSDAVSLFPIDEGMHTQTDIQMLGHVMDGSFQFKAENLKTYISIQGVCDAQSRDWIQYQYTKKGLTIGSFTLSHIR